MQDELPPDDSGTIPDNIDEPSDIDFSLKNKVNKEHDSVTIRNDIRYLDDFDKIDLPVISAENADLNETLLAAWDALLKYWDKTRNFFLRNERLVRLQYSNTGAPKIVDMSAADVLLLLSRAAIWVKRKGPDFIVVQPRDNIAKFLMSDPNSPIPCLDRISTCPVFDEDGTLIFKHGYDEKSRIYLHWPVEFPYEIPDVPTEEEVATARYYLTEDLFGDFPLADEASMAHCVAAILQHFARNIINGITPMYCLWKSTPGVGASLACDLIITIISGEAANAVTQAGGGEELRKQVAAQLMLGPAYVYIDNVATAVDSPELASFITQEYPLARILGKSTMAQLTNKALWLLTGNNPSFSGENGDRTVSIELKVDMACPQDRRPEGGWRHEDIRTYVKEGRNTFIWAAAVLIRNYLAKVKEGYTYTGPTMNRFVKWSGTLGAMLELAGIPGFLTNRERFKARNDGETQAWLDFTTAWAIEFRDRRVSVKDLIAVINAYDIPLALGRSDSARRQQLGYLIKARIDRRFGPFSIRAGCKGDGVNKYRIDWAEGEFDPSAHQPMLGRVVRES